MSNYYPDNWVILEINGDTTHYRVLAGWSGGYTTGSSWKINSGIIKVEETEKAYLFYGSSGSCYHCNKESYGLRMNNAYVWNSLQKDYKNRIKLLDENTDWTAIAWNLEERN